MNTLRGRINWYIFIVLTFSLTFNVVKTSAYASLDILRYNPELVEYSMFTQLIYI